MPKPNEASSLTEDYVDDVAKLSECDSSSIKENKGFMHLNSIEAFGTAWRVVGGTLLIIIQITTKVRSYLFFNEGRNTRRRWHSYLTTASTPMP